MKKYVVCVVGFLFFILGCYNASNSFNSQFNIEKWVRVLPKGIPISNDARSFKVDDEDLASLLLNFDIQRSGLPILYNHGTTYRGPIGAGWASVCEVRDDGFYCYLHFNREATQEIKDKKWHYISVYMEFAKNKDKIEGKDEYKYLHPIALYEISLVNTPAIAGLNYPLIFENEDQYFLHKLRILKARY